MKRFIRELRRREVFRTAGLYVGISWIVIEASSIVLPTFGAPDWTMQAVIIAAFVGFPIMLVLTWIYDITDEGVVVQGDATDNEVVPFGGRKTDFVVIGILSIALIFSVYLNFSSGPDVDVEHDPVSVLIADFDNRTGNELFDGSLEQALHLGIEGASFITTYSRNSALKQAQNLSLGEDLSEEVARLVSVRQDVKMVLAGSIAQDGDGYELTIRALESTAGEVIAEADASADSSADVLAAINSLAASIREDLGDDSSSVAQLRSVESVTANSLEALKDYTTAQEFARAGQDQEAIAYYEKAVAADPDMARAYSGWGLSAHKLGNQEDSDEQWQKALSLLDRMTERERYRTLGLYYTVVSQNYDKAIDNYRQLVEKFPADGAGNNNLAILYTFTAQFDKALAQSDNLLKIYPGRILYHANHAQYAVYAGDTEQAATEAQYVIDNDPTFFKSYMILAIVALHNDDLAKAKQIYQRMAEAGGVRGASLATIGLADIALYEGYSSAAVNLLTAAIAIDQNNEDGRGAATKIVALAQARLALGDSSGALQTIDGLDISKRDGQLVPTAEIMSANGRVAQAHEIAESYRTQLRPTARAYAYLIDGMNALNQGEPVIAIDALQEALGYADMWIVRYYLGQAYLSAGYPAEAGAEFESCIARRTEAAGMFFDDVPTWRYTATLKDWQSRANKALTESLTAKTN